ncbi:MAG TPA: hypothetical protein PKE45_06030, partial [Caldilineaceae bacterium]|nr:hypothetical protein [Caldilineaceae bacterium]
MNVHMIDHVNVYSIGAALSFVNCDFLEGCIPKEVASFGQNRKVMTREAAKLTAPDKKERTDPKPGNKPSLGQVCVHKTSLDSAGQPGDGLCTLLQAVVEAQQGPRSSVIR